MALVINCPDTTWDSRTLAQLRQMVFDGLGFLALPALGTGVRTLGDLRQDIKDRLGLAAKIQYQSSNLGTMQAELFNMLGQGAISGTPPPGSAAQMTSFLNQAQQTIYKRIEMDAGLADVLVTSVTSLVTGSGSRAFTTSVSPFYTLGVRVRATSPSTAEWMEGVVTVCSGTALTVVMDLNNGTGTHTDWSIHLLPPPNMGSPNDVPIYDSRMIITLGLGLAKAHSGQPDAKIYLDQFERDLADQLQRAPPNIDILVNQSLRDAQRIVANRYEFSQNGAITLTAFVADGDFTTINAEPVFLLALANLKTKIGQPDAKVVMDELEHYFIGLIKYQPPNALLVVNRLLKQAQDILYRRYTVFRMERWYTWTMTIGNRFYGIAGDDNNAIQPPSPLTLTSSGAGTLAIGTYSYRVSAVNATGETVACTEQVFALTTASGAIQVAWPAVISPVGTSAVTGYRVYGRTSGAQLFLNATPTLGFLDTGSVVPAGALPASNTTSTITKAIDPRLVTYVGISLNDNVWRPLRKGVPPALYNSIQTGPPTHYDIRQCIELWPTPNDVWQLRMKGFFGLQPFEKDTDISSIDWQAIYLQALADAKAYYKMPDSIMAGNEARLYVGDLVSGSHMTERYFPGRQYDLIPATRPVLV